MIRHALAVLALCAVAGCSESASMNNPFASGASDAELAAYAANSRFPSTQPSNDLRATAVVDRSGNITIYNATAKAITDARVWVNGEFVAHVISIPAHGSVMVTRNQFYNGQGQTLAVVKTAPTSVQLQTGNELYNLQGPVWQ